MGNVLIAARLLSVEANPGERKIRNSPPQRHCEDTFSLSREKEASPNVVLLNVSVGYNQGCQLLKNEQF